MTLLPDIRLGRDRLSIQEPFTLNGYLIIDIEIIEEMSCYTTPFGRIKIKNENNYNVELRFDELNYCFDREMNYFVNRYGSYACVEGRRDVPNWSDYSFNTYINEIKLQCNKIRDSLYYSYNYDNSRYLNALKSDLRRQGRGEQYDRLRESYSYCDTYNPFGTFGTYGINLEDAYAVLRNSSWFNSPTNNNSSNSTSKYIHKYNYKPTYIYNYMPNEDKNTTLLLGAEIEVAGNEKEPDREDTVKKCIQIMNGSEDDTEDLIYSTSDSTVQIELDTMPCSLEFHKNRMNYKELFKYLDELGYKGHDCDKAGLHIHACRSYLGKSELIQQLTISKILYIIEKFNDEICVIARRNNNYSKFVGKEEVNQSLDKLYGKYIDNGKKVALNLLHKDTIEFRMFRSTLKYETFILTLEFVKDIIDFAKSVNIEQIELIKWSDLMNTFSDELKEYYNERLEKENKKKASVKEEIVTTSVRWDLNTINANRSITSLNTLSTIQSTNLNTGVVHIDESLILNREGYIPFTIQLDEPVQIEKTRLEILKDKIKSLKKQIKNSNNFMEKKNLERELNETQKELKKEKKNKKSNHNIETTAI